MKRQEPLLKGSEAPPAVSKDPLLRLTWSLFADIICRSMSRRSWELPRATHGKNSLIAVMKPRTSLRGSELKLGPPDLEQTYLLGEVIKMRRRGPLLQRPNQAKVDVFHFPDYMIDPANILTECLASTCLKKMRWNHYRSFF